MTEPQAELAILNDDIETAKNKILELEAELVNQQRKFIKLTLRKEALIRYYETGN